MTVAEVSPINTQDRRRSANQPQNVLSILRQRLKQMQVWPEAGDLFLELLHESRRVSPPLSEADNEWLPQVVSDAIDGKDIGSLYPAFFQKLVTSDKLCQVFLDELDKRQKK